MSDTSTTLERLQVIAHPVSPLSTTLDRVGLLAHPVSPLSVTLDRLQVLATVPAPVSATLDRIQVLIQKVRPGTWTVIYDFGYVTDQVHQVYFQAAWTHSLSLDSSYSSDRITWYHYDLVGVAPLDYGGTFTVGPLWGPTNVDPPFRYLKFSIYDSGPNSRSYSPIASKLVQCKVYAQDGWKMTAEFPLKGCYLYSSDVSIDPDIHDVIRVDASSGPVTVRLPRIGRPSQLYLVVKDDSSANAVTIISPYGDLVHGSSSQSITTQYGFFRLTNSTPTSGWTTT